MSAGNVFRIRKIGSRTCTGIVANLTPDALVGGWRTARPGGTGLLRPLANALDGLSTAQTC